MSELAYIQNSRAQIATFNKKFNNFNNFAGNLGSSVTYDVQPKFATTNSLVAVFQTAEQRVRTLTVDQPFSTSYQFSAEEFIFGAKEYMEKYGKTAAIQLASSVEGYISSVATKSIYRYYGNGNTSITSYGMLASAVARLHNIGVPQGTVRGYLPDVAIPGIITTGLQQFAPKRNDEIANSWELGKFAGVEWYSSNMLSLQNAGLAGTTSTALTISTVTRGTRNEITSLTCTYTPSTEFPAAASGAVCVGDVMTINDSALGNPRFLTYSGQQTSCCPVQMVSTTAPASSSSTVILTFSPALYDSYSVQSGVFATDNLKNQNVNLTIVPNMTITVANSHYVGYLLAGDAGYLATPRLPDEVPFPTANSSDPSTGFSFRKYYGAMYGQNKRGMVNDIICGASIVPEYGLKIIFPATIGV
jgi:hypothetical protein